MNHQKSELYFLLALLLGIFILIFFIFKPFFYALALAIIFATVFNPVHRRVLALTKGRKSLAAFLTTLFVLIVVVVPLSLLAVQILQEATGLYSYISRNNGAADISHSVESVMDNFKRFLPIPIEFSFDINQYARQGLNWLLQHFGSLFSNIARAIIGIFIFLVALYYLFKDGQKLKEAVITLSPLEDIHDETIFSRLGLAVNSVVKGNLAVALVQGTLTAIGFAIFGVPNPILWGSMAAIAALIPGIGTVLVFLPAILFLFFTGETLPALGLLLWGTIAVGLVDNFLGPKFVERGMRLHPFLILLSILGGIGLFGPFGFLLGPIALSLLFALLDIYFVIREEHID